MQNISNITVSQIKEMKHCVGFYDNRITGVKHRIMHCYRNYFCDYKDNKNWNDLINRGLASKGKSSKDGIVYFRLTKDGFKFLANLYGFEKMYEID